MVVFFFSFTSNFSCFEPSIKNGKWSLLIWHLFQWHLGNYLFSPSSIHCPAVYSSRFPASTAFLLGSFSSCQERQAPSSGNRRCWSLQNFSGMWDRWKDKHPWSRRRLETFTYASVYISIWLKISCVHISRCIIYMVQLVNVCVSVLVSVGFCHDNWNEKSKKNFLFKHHQGLNGFRCVVWKTRTVSGWQRALQALNNVMLLITSCEFMLWKANILQRLCQGWKDPNLTHPENEVCLMLLIHVVPVPSAVRVWCSECGRCSLLPTC